MLVPPLFFRTHAVLISMQAGVCFCTATAHCECYRPLPHCVPGNSIA